MIPNSLVDSSSTDIFREHIISKTIVSVNYNRSLPGDILQSDQRSTLSLKCIRKQTSFTSLLSSVYNVSTDNSHLSNNSVKLLTKSHSSPLPIKSINQISSEYVPKTPVFTCSSAIGKKSLKQTSISTSSLETNDSITDSLLRYHISSNYQYLNGQWDLSHFLKEKSLQLPSTFKRIWQKRINLTGSREFLLECDLNNNNHAQNYSEQRYVEQERPIQTYTSLAFVACLAFPPIGVLAMFLSLWSIYGQQDRHLTRKFGTTVYWISLFAIVLPVYIILIISLQFTYRHLVNQYHLLK